MTILILSPFYKGIVKALLRSYISLTVFSDQQQIIGAASFNDFPQGLRGRYDNVHDNLWEDWLDKAYNVQGLTINSYNCIWLTFLHISPAYMEHLEEIVDKMLQSLYVLQPQLEGVLFLKRG